MNRPRPIEPAAPRRPDPAIVELVKALARQAAREDHERENRSQHLAEPGGRAAS